MKRVRHSLTNSRIKAEHYAAKTGMLTVAEDSGLAIDALDGRAWAFDQRDLTAKPTKKNFLRFTTNFPNVEAKEVRRDLSAHLR